MTAGTTPPASRPKPPATPPPPAKKPASSPPKKTATPATPKKEVSAKTATPPKSPPVPKTTARRSAEPAAKTPADPEPKTPAAKTATKTQYISTPAPAQPAPAAPPSPAPAAQPAPTPAPAAQPTPTPATDFGAPLVVERRRGEPDPFANALAQGPKLRGRVEIFSDAPAFGYYGNFPSFEPRPNAGAELNKIAPEVQRTARKGETLEADRKALEDRSSKYTVDQRRELTQRYDSLRSTIEAEGKKGPIPPERAKELRRSLDELDAGLARTNTNARELAGKTYDDHIAAQLAFGKERDGVKAKTADAVLKDQRDEAAEAAKRPPVVDPADRLRLFPGGRDFDRPSGLRGFGTGDLKRDLDRVGDMLRGKPLGGDRDLEPPGGKLDPLGRLGKRGALVLPEVGDDPLPLWDGGGDFKPLKLKDGTLPRLALVDGLDGLEGFGGGYKERRAEDALKGSFIRNADPNVERDQRALADDARAVLGGRTTSADGLADWKKLQLKKLDELDAARADETRRAGDLLKEAETPLMRDRLALEERAAGLRGDVDAYSRLRTTDIARQLAPVTGAVNNATRGVTPPEETDALRARVRADVGRVLGDNRDLKLGDGVGTPAERDRAGKLRGALDGVAGDQAKLNEQRRALGLAEYRSPALDGSLDRLRDLDKRVDAVDKDLTRKLNAKDDSLSRFEKQLRADPEQKRAYMETLRRADPSRLNYVEAHLAEKLIKEPEYQKTLADYDQRTGLGPDAEKVFHRDTSELFDPSRYIPGQPRMQPLFRDNRDPLRDPFGLGGGLGGMGRERPGDIARGLDRNYGYADLFGDRALPQKRSTSFSEMSGYDQRAYVKEALGHKLFQDGLKEKYKTTDFSKIPKEDLARDYREWDNYGRNKRLGELKDADYQKYIDEAKRVDAIHRDPSNLDLRLRKEPRDFTSEEAKIYTQHRDAADLRRLDRNVGERVKALDAEYKKNGWSPDSAWAGVSPQLFLQELNAKDARTVSSHDARRALATIDGFRKDNAAVFADSPDRLAAAGEKGNALYKGTKEGAFRDLNDPFERLRRPIEELSPEERALVLRDHTRMSVESLEKKMRGQSIQGVLSAAHELDAAHKKMLDERGFLGHTADFFKNNLGADDGWVIDSKMGSDALGKTVAGVHRARAELEKLKDFKGSHDEFQKAYEEKRAYLETQIRASVDHMKKYTASQERWTDGIADFGSVLAAVGAAALAPATGGGSLVALGLAVGAGATTKVALKGTDALVGGREYDSFGRDLLSGGINGLGAGAGAVARKKATEYMVKRAGYDLTKESLAMMPLRTKLAIAGAGSSLEGGIFGTTAGGATSALRGDPPEKVLEHALWGGAFGMVLNPLGEGTLRGLGAAYKGARGKEIPGVLDGFIPKVKPNVGDDVAAAALGKGGAAEQKGLVTEAAARAADFEDAFLAGGTGRTRDQARELLKLSGGQRIDDMGFGVADEIAGTVDRAVARAVETGDPAYVLRASTRNLAGVVKQDGHSGANEFYARMVRITEEELNNGGLTNAAFRDGADATLVVSGKKATPEALKEALGRAEKRIAEEVRKKGYHELPHPKHPEDPAWKGFGMTFAEARLGAGDKFAAVDEALKKKVLEANGKLGQIPDPPPVIKLNDVKPPADGPLPSGGPQRRPKEQPFLDPIEHRRQEFMKRARDMGVPEEEARQLFKRTGGERLDPDTGYHFGEDRGPTMQRAIEHLRKTGEDAYYVEMDIRNLGSLNRGLGRPGAVVEFKVGADLIKEELRAVKADVSLFHHGGDEISAVVVGPNVTQATIDAALTRAQARFRTYMQARGLGDLVHPKYPNDPAKRGIGFTFSTKQALTTDTPESVFRAADQALELLKKAK